MIQLENVSKVFHSPEKSYRALHHVNLSINEGEYVAIVGKSGSGKSTLLNMMTGIDRPTEGTVSLNHTIVNKLDESDLAKWRGQTIGIVFQFFQLIPTLTVLENILLAMEFVNVIAKKERKTRALRLLESVGIADQANKRPASLSGGQQQRAAIARALANNPAMLVADEPTGNLDSKTAADIYELFQQLVKQGKTVIVVTHEKDAAAKYHRVITISDGSVINDSSKR